MFRKGEKTKKLEKTVIVIHTVSLLFFVEFSDFLVVSMWDPLFFFVYEVMAYSLGCHVLFYLWAIPFLAFSYLFPLFYLKEYCVRLKKLKKTMKRVQAFSFPQIIILAQPFDAIQDQKVNCPYL